MPPVLIIALVGAVLALLVKDSDKLPEDQQKDLENLQKDLADARKGLRHAQNAKKRYIASTGAKQATDDK